MHNLLLLNAEQKKLPHVATGQILDWSFSYGAESSIWVCTELAWCVSQPPFTSDLQSVGSLTSSTSSRSVSAHTPSNNSTPKLFSVAADFLLLLDPDSS